MTFPNKLGQDIMELVSDGPQVKLNGYNVTYTHNAAVPIQSSIQQHNGPAGSSCVEPATEAT